jgi:hypothetical protein
MIGAAAADGRLLAGAAAHELSRSQHRHPSIAGAFVHDRHVLAREGCGMTGQISAVPRTHCNLGTAISTPPFHQHNQGEL